MPSGSAQSVTRTAILSAFRGVVGCAADKAVAKNADNRMTL